MKTAPKVLALLLGMSLLSSCFGQSTYRWKEEVLLHDGRVIVIERSVRTGEVPVELNQRPGESDYTLTFRADNGKTVTWEAGKSFWPMILDFENGVPYVVASGITSTDFERNGCPRPPYFFSRFLDGRWERVAYERFPQTIRDTNLLVSPTRPGRIEAVSRGLVTLADVKKSHLGLSPWRKRVLEIAPNPCADWNNDMKYVPSR